MKIDLVGGSYQLAKPHNGTQRTINMFVVKRGEQTLAFKDVPGLVEFVAPYVHWTSWLYPYIYSDSLDSSLAIPVSGQLWQMPIDDVLPALAVPVSGTLTSILRFYGDWAAEGIDSSLAIPIGGTLASILKFYNDWPIESLNAVLATPISGTLQTVLVQYPNWPTEPLDSQLAIPINGTLGPP